MITGDFVEELAAALELESKDKTHAILAQTLLDLYKGGLVSNFPAAFEVVERVLIYGSEEDQQLVIVGFLENVKNYSVRDDLDYAVFEEWLGPETHTAWRWLEKHWQGKRSLASEAEGRNRQGAKTPKS